MAARYTQLGVADLGRRTEKLFGNSNFAPLAGQGRTNLGGAVSKVVIYYLGRNVSNNEQVAIMTALVSQGRSSTSDKDKWMTWLFTYICVAYPVLGDKLKDVRDKQFVWQEIPESFIADCTAVGTILEDDSITATVTPTLPDLIDDAPDVTPELFNACTIVGVYGVLAIAVHLMGKNIDANKIDAITTRRPQNIIDSFGAQDARYVLSGLGRLSNAAHIGIKSAWGMASSLRKVCVHAFAHMHGSDMLPERVVYLMFRLLQYSGMQNATFIRDLLEACPWVIEEIPHLRSEYNHYRQSIHEYSQESEVTRPYIKLFHGDATNIFHNKTLVHLTGIAVTYLSRTNEELAGYTHFLDRKTSAAFANACEKYGVNLPDDIDTQAAAPAADLE